MTSAEIRQQFLDFFTQKHGHTFVPSSPVVPLDDPTLLFINAGMNQFKPIFLGLERRAYVRAANTQKCIRAGGKHNDLDDVGRSRRHHTFFEMLGNWSFGDYFKRGAIEMAWELLTKVWKLDPTRLHASCYEGDEPNGIPRDTEAANLWKEIARLPDDHIHYFGKDNFWMMGDTGPCGPCTEIYIDRTPDKSGGPQVNGEDPRVMEIWNLVFIQYNRDASGKLTPLPAKHVDTGMGLGRICQVLQDKQDNYATDLWTPLLDRIAALSHLKYTGKFPPTNAADPALEAADPQLRHDIAFRVVADHAQCLTFALTDGAEPSNEGRGYVLRRILRRAVRFGRQQLGLNESFLYKLVPIVVDSMGGAFPELRKNPNRVIELIKNEETSFGRTLDRGITLFQGVASMAQAVASGNYHSEPDAPSNLRPGELWINPKDAKRYVEAGPHVIPAEEAFQLHDTFGFPIDLTRIMAEELGMSVDLAGYEKLMEEARELARAGGKERESKLTMLSPEAIAQLEALGIVHTNDAAKFSRDPIQTKVAAIWNGRSLVDSVHETSDEFAVILDRTNFYSEMGGQVGDQGQLAAPGTSFLIHTTRSVGGYILHIGKLNTGAIKVGSHLTATADPVLRPRTEKNHTSTHLANWALREVLGDGVQQKGSLVDPEKLRFDFSHGKAMTTEELAQVEQLVNQQIALKLPVYAEEAPQEKALRINGLRAVFGEKYPPMVRVVSIGAPVKDLLADPSNAKWRQFSIEFCGGTHLKASNEAESFVISSEESVSKGIRRIVALTGDPARSAASEGKLLADLLNKAKSADDASLQPLIAQINERLSSAVLPLGSKRQAQAAVVELQSRVKAFEKAGKSQPATNVDAVKLAGDLLAAATAIGPGKLIIGEISGANDDQLRSAIDSLRKKSPSHAIMLAAIDGQKVTFVAAVSDDIIAKGLKAGDWIKQTATAAGGGGGGRPQMAQGSGKDPSKIREALDVARNAASKIG
jgi:alanyl-tRNA synthetase